MLLSGNVMLLSGNVMLLIKKFNNSKTAENRHFFKAIFRRKQEKNKVKTSSINLSIKQGAFKFLVFNNFVQNKQEDR